MATALMVSSEHEKIKDNPAWMLGGICVLGGQGACLVFFSCMQALMNLQTIQSSHVIATCCVSYYLGADSFIVALKNGLFPETLFTNFVMSLAIAAFILTLFNSLVITDEEDAQGFFGKAEALTKGIIYKKTNYAHLFILAIYTMFLMGLYFMDVMKSTGAAWTLSFLIVANLLVPLSLVWLLDSERIKTLVGEPSDIEKKLSNKGVDLEFSDAAVRVDFWYLAICSCIIIGVSRMFDENAQALGLQQDARQEMIEDTFSVYEVIGAFVCGMVLTLFRSKFRPSLMIIYCALIGCVGQMSMIYPSAMGIDAMQFAVATAAFSEGGLMVSLASLVHEEYGTENFGILYGTFLSFGAVGLFALDEMYFPNIYDWYSHEHAAKVNGFTKYGDWNKFLFGSLSGAYFICVLLALVSHVSISRREAADSQKLVMVKF
jgi:hypothetical protein